MKQISNKEYEKYQQYQTDKLHGRILTPDGLRVICAGLDNDPEKIGIHMLEMLAKFRNEGMDRFTAHQLRHTYATMLYDAGVDVKTAQDFLGHADPTVTMNIYTHLSSQKKESAIQALQQHFSDTIPEAL